jgi:DNA-directed RNA polymerase subunit RPC12/RpoP
VSSLLPNPNGRVTIDSLHDPFDLVCPVCGHRIFKVVDVGWLGCGKCGVEISIQEEKETRRMIIELQGA